MLAGRMTGMDKRRACLPVSVVLLLLLLLLAAGCAHEKAYKRGDRLSQQGRYEQAIEELEDAIRLAEEGNNRKAAERYRERLAEVKLQAGQFFYREAQIRFAQADLGAAQRFIELCVTYCPQEQTYWSFRQRVQKAIANAEQLRTEALSLADQGQWQAAMARMNEALTLYRTMPGGDADFKRIRDRAYRHFLDRAQGKLLAGDIDAAEVEAQTALVYQQDGREAKALIQTVKDRREAAGLVARGRTLLDSGSAQEALDTFEQAYRLYPSHPELRDLLGRARRAVCDGWLEQGRQALAAHDSVAAMHLFRRSQALLAGYGGVDALLLEARSRLAEVHLEASRQYQQSGAHGCAVLHATAALGYQPDDFEARRQLGQCAEQVRDEVGYAIAFVGFKAPAGHQSLAAILGSTAIEHLMRVRPANVALVERADLQAILDEQRLSATDLIDPESRVAAGRLHGVDALLVGQILDGKVTIESKRTGYGESVWQDGYRSEPNPDHVHAAAVLDTAVHELETARKRLAEAEARLARYRHVDPTNADEVARRRKAQADVDEAKQRLVNAATDVGAAQARLAMIPPKVLVPNMVKHQYPIETFTKDARITCMLKLLDTATGEILIAERIEGRHSQSDRVVARDPRRNVPEDPLDLPPEAAMLESAAGAATGRLKQVLTTACMKHGERFVEGMRRAEAARDTLGAVDNCVKYLFAYPTGHDRTNAMLDYLRKYLGDENTFIDIAQLLRGHCLILGERRS